MAIACLENQSYIHQKDVVELGAGMTGLAAIISYQVSGKLISPKVKLVIEELFSDLQTKIYFN